jgi:hypothetical protein
MPQEGRDLVLVEVEAEVVDGTLPVLVDLGEVADPHTQGQMLWLRLKVTRYTWRGREDPTLRTVHLPTRSDCRASRYACQLAQRTTEISDFC